MKLQSKPFIAFKPYAPALILQCNSNLNEKMVELRSSVFSYERSLRSSLSWTENCRVVKKFAFEPEKSMLLWSTITSNKEFSQTDAPNYMATSVLSCDETHDTNSEFRGEFAALIG